MLFAEPPRTQGDLLFSVFGIPVRVHPFFWLVAVVLGLNAGELIGVFVWVVAVFVSILVHELGHATVMRGLGLSPWIVLHGMGGLACYDPSQLYRSRGSGWVSQVFISLAGPGAGFLLAALTAVLVVATGHWVGIFFGAPYGLRVVADGISSSVLLGFVNDLLFISVVWGLVNLLPVYPLDGGHVAREILTRINTQEGIRRSLILSTATGALVAAYAVSQMIVRMRLITEMGGSPTQALRLTLQDANLYVALLFGYLAYSSYQAIATHRGGGRQW